MFFKQILLLFMLMQAMVFAFGVDLQATNLKSEFSVKCFGIMQPLLQEIAVKKEKIDRFDEIIQNKENTLVEIQSKYDQVQIKLAVAETALREKEHQLVQQQDLCNSHRNNSNVKDELLKAYKLQVQDKTIRIEQLLKESKEQAELLDSCKLQAKAKEVQIEQLQEVAQANELLQLATAKNVTQKEEQIQQLLFDAKETKEQIENYKSQIKSKDEQLEKLHAEIHWNNVKVQELENSLRNKDQQIAELQAEVKRMLNQRSALGLQVDASEMQIEQKQSEIKNLQSELHEVQAQLSEYRMQVDRLQSTNCHWFGNSSDIHKIRAPGIDPFEVLCDSRLAGPGWTVIQRRIDGSENFYRNWSDYRVGFGSLQGEFFIGMEKLYRLTMAQTQELYIHLEAFDNSTYFARYADFSVGSESEAYALKLLGTYTGNASDALYFARNRKFSTHDVDNDRSDGNCAEQKHGAWWYDRCGHSNLNGRYLNEGSKDHIGIYWLGRHAFSFKAVQMMLRPKSVQYT
ncbi:angiopoietin-related protein 7 [Drosophila virilis]|uniref:Fibrinogen C-terminal domain-containing protein n=1 Tax=Drosophila virilis TaxID=7244 RepID=B4M3G3_DROVI|nr:angiopoietin-related protein 7 [Drosophila virilis]EDW65338.2 uncharacterized protein Dvir_GJ19208 [Drosophila virilis]